MRQVDHRRATEKGSCPFDGVAGAQGSIDGRAIIRISFQGEQGHFYMLDVLTALSKKICQQLAIYRRWECFRRRGYDLCMH